MRVHITATFDAEDAHSRRLSSNLRRRTWDAVRRVSFNAERQAKTQMPVDTGRARASWGHSTAPASAADGVWEEDESSLSITQGSLVEYIGRLNEGYSKQAPAGFIDAIAYAAREELSAAVADLMREEFR